MEFLEAEFRISEIKVQTGSSQRFVLILKTRDWRKEHSTELTLDQNTCDRLGINVDVSLIGKDVVCRLTPESVRDGEGEFVVDIRQFHADKELLFANKLTRKESCEVHHGQRVPILNDLEKLTLILRTPRPSGMAPVPHPLYEINFPVTEEEYTELMTMLATHAFRFSMTICEPEPKPDEV